MGYCSVNCPFRHIAVCLYRALDPDIALLAQQNGTFLPLLSYSCI